MHMPRACYALGAAFAIHAATVSASEELVVPPWQVIKLSTYSPSGRPNTSPDYYVSAAIRNPDPSKGDAASDVEVDCKATWQYPDLPYNKSFDCVLADGTVSSWSWSMEPIQANSTSASSTTNFVLAFQAISNTATSGESIVWAGTQSFAVGDNLQGTCAGSGFCSWALKPEKTPVLIDAHGGAQYQRSL
ncbi:hypothetical protein GGR57DRAFT_496201 [Xylariaceae sp. FL1272]|nr:hypothetical protein GGR57DRAFT_496201 [Xylariaceae sp. FL1272]